MVLEGTRTKKTIIFFFFFKVKHKIILNHKLPLFWYIEWKGNLGTNKTSIGVYQFIWFYFFGLDNLLDLIGAAMPPRKYNQIKL